MNDKRRASASRFLVVALMAGAVVAASTGTAGAVQLIPSLGFTKSTESNAGDGKFNAGLALRAPLLPFLSAEGGISYRDESLSNGDVTVRMWPVTASLWLTPVPMVYAGGGLGWYRTSYDYNNDLPFENTTTNDVGIHLGGGVAVPLAPTLGLDLNGRYIFMQENNNVQLPTEFDPGFWSLSLGLAIQL
ncbi:MAG TPA: outer membrane beta-barrel protein [Acidobacteriota bacterium]|nr:outer membrane beta-barrel protein [Acidobacteriota bacterium]